MWRGCRDTVIERRDGALVTLRQIARVRDTYENLTRLIRVNGERGLRLAIRKQAGANTVEVARRVLEQVEAVNAEFPQIRIVPVIDQGNFIERAIANVSQSLLYGGALAVLVLLFFLRDLRSTLVISLAIPISVIATFALLYFGGFTLNLMTLGGVVKVLQGLLAEQVPVRGADDARSRGHWSHVPRMVRELLRIRRRIRRARSVAGAGRLLRGSRCRDRGQAAGGGELRRRRFDGRAQQGGPRYRGQPGVSASRCRSARSHQGKRSVPHPQREFKGPSIRRIGLERSQLEETKV